MDIFAVRLNGQNAGQQQVDTEYDLLANLSVNAGCVMTHEDLLHRMCGLTNLGSPRVIRVQLMRLRQKLGEDGKNPTSIFTEPRVVHRMAERKGQVG